jgi:hypothetical protein
VGVILVADAKIFVGIRTRGIRQAGYTEQQQGQPSLHLDHAENIPHGLVIPAD